jgi:hypothetical protein
LRWKTILERRNYILDNLAVYFYFVIHRDNPGFEIYATVGLNILSHKVACACLQGKPAGGAAR